MKKRFTLLALCLLAGSGCTNMVSKGDKLYAQGQYIQAAEVYEKILDRDPTNNSASKGLRQTRTMIIDRQLVEVGTLRNASKHEAAAQNLQALLLQQDVWGLYIQGPVAATQDEEIRQAGFWLEERAKALSTSSHPDELKWFLHSFNYLIGSAQLDDALSQYQPTLKQRGAENCQRLATTVSGQRFYLKAFVSKYCQSWESEVEDELEVDAVDHSRYKALTINHEVNIETPTNETQAAILKNKLTSLEKQFHNTLWYSEQGAEALFMKVSGVINHEIKTRNQSYIRRFTIIKEIKNEDGTAKLVKDKAYFKYPVTVHNEIFTVKLDYVAPATEIPIKYSINDIEKNLTETHNTHYRPAEVYPRTAKFMEIDNELTESLVDANGQLNQQFESTWINRYCDQGDEIEKLLRCGKAEPDNTHVNHWFSNQFGVDYKGMAELYDL